MKIKDFESYDNINAKLLGKEQNTFWHFCENIRK